VAFRLRAGIADSNVSSSRTPTLLQWKSDSTHYLKLSVNSAKQWTLDRQNVGGATATIATGTFTPGTLFTVVAAWTATQLKLSINGAAFTTVSNSSVPALSGIQLFDLGSDAGSMQFDGDIFWSATGSGVLANADATTLNNFGNSDPSFAALPGTPTMLWTADSGAVQTPTYTTTLTYDDADRVASETDPASRVYRFYYDSRNNLRSTQYPNGTFSWADRNANGWLTGVYNRHGTLNGSETNVPGDSQASPIIDYSYAYTQDGQRSTEVRSGGGLSTQTTTYSYDSLGRLAQTLLPTGVCRNYGYDRDSNRAQIQESATGCLGSFSIVSSYNYTAGATGGIDTLTSQTVHDSPNGRDFAGLTKLDSKLSPSPLLCLLVATARLLALLRSEQARHKALRCRDVRGRACSPS
jgi:YD repeat-containing protein